MLDGSLFNCAVNILYVASAAVVLKLVFFVVFFIISMYDHTKVKIFAQTSLHSRTTPPENPSVVL